MSETENFFSTTQYKYDKQSYGPKKPHQTRKTIKTTLFKILSKKLETNKQIIKEIKRK